MPGNDSGDRVYNFFPQDNLLQGNHHQQTVEGTWSVANNNFWAGGQTGLPNTSTKNDNIQHSDTNRGQDSHALPGQSGLNFTQTSSNFAKNIMQRQQLNSNGYMFGNHVNQTRQDGANILAADTIPDHHNLVSRGLSMYESHPGNGFHQHQTKPVVRSETSESPLTFNLFGNQQQMQYPQSSMHQSIQKQQSGFSDVQQLQQQIMLRKMQELQRQQQLRQTDGVQQNAANPISPFSKQLTGSYPSAMVNGLVRAETQNSSWGTESGNTNWLQRASSVVQGSPNGFVNYANHGQALSSISSGVQMGDQSVYGDTFSGSRGNLTQFSEITIEKASMEKVAASSNNTLANQYQACVDQPSMQEESMTSRLGFPGENPFCNPPGRYVQQPNPMKRNASPQEIHHEVARSQEKTLSEDDASRNVVSLDPTEARILYGSEDNIWAAFGKSLDDCGDADGPFDQFQSGTWSALMQSAVAETSSNDVGQQEALGSSSQREGSNISSPGVLQNANIEVRPTHGSVLHSCVPETNSGSYRGPWSPAHSGLRDQYCKSSVYNPSESASRFTDTGILEPEKPSLRSQCHVQKTGMNLEVGHAGFPFTSCPKPSSITEVDHSKSISGNIPVTRGGFILSNATVTPNLSSTQSNESSQAMLWRNINSKVLSYGSDSVDRPQHYIDQENQRAGSSLNSRGKENADTSEMENCKRNDSSNNSYCSDQSHNNSSGGVKGYVMPDVDDSHSFPSGKKMYLNHNKSGKAYLDPRKFQRNSMGNADEDTQHYHGVNNSYHSLMSQQSSDFEPFKVISQVPKGSVDVEKGQTADKKDDNGIDDTCGNIPSHLYNSVVPFNQPVDMCTPIQDTPSSNQNRLELLHKIEQLRGHGLLMHSSPSGGHNASSELPEKENCGSSTMSMQQNNTSTSQVFGFQLGPPSHRTALPSRPFISQGSLQKGNNSHQRQDASDIGERGSSQLDSSPAVHSLPPLSKREFNRNRSALPEQVNHAFMHKMPGSHSSASSYGCPRSRSPYQYQQMVKECGQVSQDHQDAYHTIQKNDLVSRSFIGQTTDTTYHREAWNSQLNDSDLSKGTSNQIRVPELQLGNSVPPTSAKDVSVSQAMNSNAQQGTSFEMLPHTWSNIPGQPHSLSSHISRTSSNVRQLHQPNVLESNSFPHKHGEQESIVGNISPSVSGSSSMNKGSPAQQVLTRKVNMAQRDELQRPEPPSNNFLDCSPLNSVSMQNDIESFGQSLMSNNSSQQNYSLLHQMGITKSAETNPNERARKRMKSLGSIGECQQLNSKASKSIDNAVGQHASVSSVDSKILSFSGLVDNAGSKAYAQLGNVISQNIHASSQENSLFNHDGNNCTPVKVDHLCISPQMTPSWLIQHEGFRNGHMLTGYDAQRGTGSKTTEPLFSHGETFSDVHISNSNEPVAAADIGPGKIGTIQQSPIPISAAVEPQSLVLNEKRSKKRERATFQLTSWCKELSQKSQNHRTISMAELHWAKAANRLTEKIEDEVKFSEDGPILRAKRRVILTTQLMQQLLSPPKSSILSSEAESNYDYVAYSVSRLALGEACGLLPNLNSDSHHVVSLLSGNYNELEKVNDRHLSKLVDGFMGRAQKLESDFLRIDNRASLVDVSSECQELEKFSVINRFAKFHGRGQTETGDASSSSNGAANALRPYPQRYVTALPVPKNLPDRVHCLSL